MRCINCGSENQDTNKFCFSCGMKLPISPNNSEPAPATNPKKKKNKTLLIIGILILTLAIITICVIFFISSSGTKNLGDTSHKEDSYTYSFSGSINDFSSTVEPKDLKAGQVLCNNNLITVGETTLDDIASMGYTITSDEIDISNEKLGANQTVSVTAQKDESELSLDITNKTQDDIDCGKATVNSLCAVVMDFEYIDSKNQNKEIYYLGGINILDNEDTFGPILKNNGIDYDASSEKDEEDGSLFDTLYFSDGKYFYSVYGSKSETSSYYTFIINCNE